MGLITFMRFLADTFKHSLFNELDYRYWVRLWLFLIVDSVLLIISTIQTWEDEVARIYLMLANTFMIMCIVLACIFGRHQYWDRQALLAAFNEADSNKDGRLDETEMKSLLKHYPAGSFARFKIKGKMISFSTVALAKTPPRSHMALQMTEFIADWLSFFATLILFDAGSKGDPVVVAQGIVAVLDLSFVLHEILSSYLSKYKVTTMCCMMILGIVYWSGTLMVMALFFSGFAVSIEIAAFVDRPEIQGSHTTDVTKSAGFWTGWVISGIIVLHLMFHAFFYYCLSFCGCVLFRGRRKFGERRLLGRRNDKSKDKPVVGEESEEDDDSEELDDDYETQTTRTVIKRIGKHAERKVIERINQQAEQFQVITNFSSATNLGDPETLKNLIPAAKVELKHMVKAQIVGYLKRTCCCCCCGCKCS